MAHSDPELLTLRALGEDVGTSTDEAHLAACPTCGRELEQLRAVVRRARALTPDDRVAPEPPPRVWDAVAAATGVEATAERSGEPGHADRDLRAVAADQAAADQADVVAIPSPRQARTSPSRPARRAPRWRQPQWLIAAALAVVALVAGAALLAGPGTGPVEELVAETRLEPLDAPQPGQARLVALDDSLRLEVAAEPLPEFDGYYAVWLIDADVEGMLSLGPLADDGVHVVPAGVDPGAYPVVDVSREPFDGDPTHSGDSVLRGILPLE